MDVTVLDNEDIGFDEALAREQTGGTRFGTVGSRIVAEVLIGLITSDPGSFRTVQPGWEPELPAHDAGGKFGMADLVAFALDY
ncbi:hypothetical protein [Halorientalis pallida]|uniref:Uncharacterized protein n=1 Tax=Halorientalis pallida TaxID=2479928 RepID=A0A498KYK2_9EURY|nr:hypothetical protein [Halorientalis pallida]RXK50348.1 hypothetical protein EAF64_07255 [Halorientalis pallida]